MKLLVWSKLLARKCGGGVLRLIRGMTRVFISASMAKDGDYD